MKTVLKAYNDTPLILRIVIGLVIGVVLALLIPGNTWIELLGTLFTSALKAAAPLLVFFLVASSLASARTAGNMKTVVVLYIVSTVVAGLIAVIASYVSPSTLVLASADGIEQLETAPEGIDQVIVNLLTNALANPIEAIVEANFLGVLMWGIMLGIAMRRAKPSTKEMLHDAASGITTVVRWIINCAPFGILGLVYTSVGESGLSIFTVYGHLVAVLVVIFLVVALITNPLIVALVARVNPFPLIFRCLKDSALFAFFTRSSAANIPVNMKLCEDLGLDEDNYSVSIPLGATINMAGACITISIMTMACANTMGIQVDFVSAVLLCVLSAVGACGASGVAGGSLLLIPLACSLFGIPAEISAQVVAVGFIIGVIQDSFETALNSSSDVVFTATAELAARRKAGLSTKLPIPESERTGASIKSEQAPMNEELQQPLVKPEELNVK